MKLWTWTAAILLLFGMTISSEANIASSKHNLSATGPGTVKATSETELCVFCHIPHNANPAVPLWNHTVTTAAYQMYTSDYLTRAGYATPTDVGQRSRLCLSCHDGTVAIGSVYTVRGAAGTIAMTGVDGAGKMMGTAAGYLGTDLRNDHPVSIKYDTGTFTTIGTRGMELNPIAPPVNPRPYTGVKLYGTAAGSIKGYVECTSCHDPHNDANPDFLVVSNAAGALCTACHSKTGWIGSIHQTSSVTVHNPAGDTQPIPAGSVANAACMSCHKNHSGLGIPYLLRKVEENTCYNGASTSCHGSSGAKKIQTVFNKWIAHPVADSGRHKNLDVLELYAVADLGAGNRHAECVDCHNPHQAKNLPRRVMVGSWYPSIGSNLIVNNSGPLTGVPGVAPGSVGNWAARATFTTKQSATYEYEICYKCHSYYAIRNSGSPLSSWIGPSGANVTDQAWEFNPGNRSAHPVEVGLNYQTGSPGTKPLAISQMTTPWTAIGTQTMYCSDCHGADNETGTDPRGPHGSNVPFMLKGPNKYWPKTASGTYYYLGGTTTGLFCLNCHPLTLNENINHVHAEDDHHGSSIPCVTCHSVVPHGSKISRLIVYNTMGAPYFYGGSPYVEGFRKATSTNYNKGNCWTRASGCSDHSKPSGTYEDIP